MVANWFENTLKQSSKIFKFVGVLYFLFEKALTVAISDAGSIIFDERVQVSVCIYDICIYICGNFVRIGNMYKKREKLFPSAEYRRNRALSIYFHACVSFFFFLHVSYFIIIFLRINFYFILLFITFDAYFSSFIFQEAFSQLRYFPDSNAHNTYVDDASD